MYRVDADAGIKHVKSLHFILFDVCVCLREREREQERVEILEHLGQTQCLTGFEGFSTTERDKVSETVATAVKQLLLLLVPILCD